MLEQREDLPIDTPQEEIDEEEAWRKEWEAAMREEQETREEEDPVKKDWELRDFVSHSRGVGRKSRPREIRLARNKTTGKSVLLKDVPTKGLDIIADELLSGRVPPDADTFVEFVKRLES